jgi:protein-disulfide isomerase
MNHLRWQAICAFVFFVLGISRPVLSQSLIEVDEFQFVKGDKNARVVLLEFADYQCSFCARFYRETFRQIDKNYILAGIGFRQIHALP